MKRKLVIFLCLLYSSEVAFVVIKLLSSMVAPDFDRFPRYSNSAF